MTSRIRSADEEIIVPNFDISEEYHVASRNLGCLRHNKAAYQTHYSPAIQKLVAEAPLHIENVSRTLLPDPTHLLSLPLGQTISLRRSVRRFSTTKSLELQQLSTLLFFGNGSRSVCRSSEQPPPGRSYPNAGGLASIEVYIIANRVTYLNAGLYHYDTMHHELSLIKLGNLADWLRQQVLYQSEFADAAVLLVLTCAFGRLKTKYGLRGYRLGLLDTGHVSENVQLVATATGMGGCATAGFIDSEVDAALGIDGLDAATTLIVAIGHPEPVER